MRDRQVFEETVLPNGMRLYCYTTEHPYGIVEVVSPIGHLHNTGRFRRGTAHMLEHLTAHRSKLCPEDKSYDSQIAAAGGHHNAQTGSTFTSYWVKVPEQGLVICTDLLVSRVFECFFLGEDLEKERHVIADERDSNPWHLGGTELYHYLETQWLGLSYDDRLQALGSDEDLAAMTVADMVDFQQVYSSPKSFVIAAGAIDRELLVAKFNITVNNYSWPSPLDGGLHWVRREYHERVFKETRQCRYFVGAFSNEPVDIMTASAIAFIGEFAADQYHGPLKRWLRDTTGLSYSQHWSWKYYPCYHRWRFEVRTGHNLVHEVRQGLLGKIREALRDEQWVAVAVARRLGKIIMDEYETLAKIHEWAFWNLFLFGRIISEAEERTLLEACRDTRYLLEVFDRYFLNVERGEFCAIPE